MSLIFPILILWLRPRANGKCPHFGLLKHYVNQASGSCLTGDKQFCIPEHADPLASLFCLLFNNKETLIQSSES